MLIDLFCKRFVLRSPLSREECVSRLHDRIDRTKGVLGYVNRDELSLRQYMGRRNGYNPIFLSAKFSSGGDQTRLDCTSGVPMSSIVAAAVLFVVFFGLFHATASLSNSYWVHGDAYDAKLFAELALVPLFFLGIFGLLVLPVLVARKSEQVLRRLVESAIAERAEPTIFPACRA